MKPSRFRRLKKSLKRAIETWYLLLKLTWSNHRETASVVDPTSKVVVSLTSHGVRINSVHLCIESIGTGEHKPARLLLHISREYKGRRLSAALKRLSDRGLEVVFCDDVGPHTKYWPYVLSQERHNLPLVTADDDKMYGKGWLKALSNAWLLNPRDINCFRAREIKLAGKSMLPYGQWPLCSNTAPNPRHFATGVGGIVYPPHFLECLKKAGDRFLEVTPYADDVWLHAVAIRNGYQIRQLESDAVEPPEVPLSRYSALHKSNLRAGRNDDYIRATYTSADLTLLEASP